MDAVAELMPGTETLVMIAICNNCKGKIVCHAPTRAVRSWTHMASVGPNGESQHGEAICPPEGSRP